MLAAHATVPLGQVPRHRQWGFPLIAWREDYIMEIHRHVETSGGDSADIWPPHVVMYGLLSREWCFPWLSWSLGWLGSTIHLKTGRSSDVQGVWTYNRHIETGNNIQFVWGNTKMMSQEDLTICYSDICLQDGAPAEAPLLVSTSPCWFIQAGSPVKYLPLSVSHFRLQLRATEECEAWWQTNNGAMIAEPNSSRMRWNIWSVTQ